MTKFPDFESNITGLILDIFIDTFFHFVVI